MSVVNKGGLIAVRKISIMTLVGANNIGAFLQAFALGKVFQDMGYDVEYLTMPNRSERQGKLNKIVRYLKQKNVKMLLYKICSGKKYAKARTELTSVNYNPDEKYDIIVVGSDEMWNVGSKSFEHYPQYFGKGISAKRIISYAPSAGNTTLEQLKAVGYDFTSFERISVRDRRTFDLVSTIDKRIPMKVLDPTFLLKSYDKYLPDIQFNKDFILVYSYGINKKDIKKIKEFSKKKNMPLLSIGTFNSWCYKNLIVSPFEFLAYMKKASFVITSTFHGTALSINLNKKFAVYVEGSEKINSLLDDFGLQSRAVLDDKTISEIFEHEIDYSIVKGMIADRREESIRYLIEALKEG